VISSITGYSQQTLGQLGEFRNGANFSQDDYGEGFPIINVKQLYQGRYASTKDLLKLLPTAVAKPEMLFLCYGDILFARSSVKVSGAGQVAMVGTCPPRTIFSGFIIRFRVTATDHIIAEYLNYILRSPAYRELLTRIATGTTITNLSQETLAALPIRLPPLAEQKSIADILGSLDDKIELNRRTNETLEAMARATFKSWFVDFDPVHAKSKGKQPEGMNAETARLFPNSFEESEIGRVPKGWKVGTIGNLASLSRDALTPTQFPNEVFDHYSIPAFDEVRLPKAESGGSIKSNKFVVPAGCVLLSKLNPRIPRVWMPDTGRHRRALCSTEFLVSLPKDGVSREFLFLLFTSAEFCERFATYVTGTSGSHQRVKPESLLSIEVVMPPKELIEAFTNVTRPMLAATNASIGQCCGLAEIRDALLPRLLSGDLAVSASKVA
jgi:type I restriction enzyme S subunit